MLTRLTAVVEDVFVVATGVLKCIGEDRHPVKGTLLVDVFGKSDDGGSQPRRVDGDGAEGVAEDVSQQRTLRLLLTVEVINLRRTGLCVDRRIWIAIAFGMSFGGGIESYV